MTIHVYFWIRFFHSMKLSFYIFLGGGIGSMARFLLSTWISGAINTLFPIGTMIINLSGSFLVGVLFEVFDNYMVSVEIRSFLLIGFLGGYTTFSSFALENTNLLRYGEERYFFMNLIAQNALSLLMVVAGIILVRFGGKFILR